MESSIFAVNPATHIAEAVKPVEPAPEPAAKPNPEPRKPTPPAPTNGTSI